MLAALRRHPAAARLGAAAAALLGLELWRAFHTLPAWVGPALLLAALPLGREVLLGGAKALLGRRFSSIKLLISVATLGAAAAGDFNEAAVVLVLYSLSEALEDVGFSRSYAALEALLARAPKQARVKGRGLVAVDALRPGDVVELRGGDAVPADGPVLAGLGAVDESPVSGEPFPQTRRPGDRLFAGTLLLDGYLELTAERTGPDSTLGRVVSLTYEASEKKLKLQTFLERFSAVYTPAIMAASLLTVALPVALGLDPGTWVRRGLSLLVIACPCALTMATPIAAFAAISTAARRGAVVKGGRVLEALAAVRLAAFDKTRTLTLGEPAVTDVRPLRGRGAEQVLSAAAGLGALSSHPLSQAVVRHAQAEGAVPHVVEGLRDEPGQGLSGDCVECRDAHHCLGSPAFADAQHPLAQETVAAIEALHAEGKTVIVVSDNGGAFGLIGLRDQVRPESRAALDALRAQGLETVLLTGDHQAVADGAAAALGLTRVLAELLPEGKADALRSLQAEAGPALMVGDGVNDAPALAAAAVGVAMAAAGSDVAVENADIALMNDHLSLLPWLRKLAKATVAKIRFNTAFAIAAKLAVLGLALAGRAGLEAAILSDVGVTVLVMLNGLTLLRFD